MDITEAATENTTSTEAVERAGLPASKTMHAGPDVSATDSIATDSTASDATLGESTGADSASTDFHTYTLPTHCAERRRLEEQLRRPQAP